MNEMTFSEWMDAVDVVLEARIGLCSSDLEDQCYADMYEDGYSPESAADEVLENVGF